MKAIVWHGGNLDLKLEDVAAPVATPGRLVIRVEASAICGSDFHEEEFGSTPPFILGHEVSGTVAQVGEGVTGFVEGDRIAIDPVQKCGVCWPCTHGVEHLCSNYRHLGHDGIPGGWAEYVAVDAANAHFLPDEVDFPRACLIEPLAVCYQSFSRAGVDSGDSVVIIGDGPFGFLHAQLAVALGADPVIIAGHHNERLSRISAATGAITCNTHEQDLKAIAATYVGPAGADIVVEASGASSSPSLGVELLRPRGTLVLFSYVWKPEPLPLGLIHMNELNVLGACRSQNGYGACIELLSRRKVDTSHLIDVKLPLEDHEVAIEKLTKHKAEVFKAIFLPQAT